MKHFIGDGFWIEHGPGQFVTVTANMHDRGGEERTLAHTFRPWEAERLWDSIAALLALRQVLVA